MAKRRLEVVDVREILRQLRMEESDRQIASRTGASRSTVAKYRNWAKEKDLLRDVLPAPGILDNLLKGAEDIVVNTQVSKAEPYRELIERMLREQGCTGQVIFERLKDNHDFGGSYSSIKRFIRRLEEKEPEAFIRVETAPGKQAQVDFGYAGKMFDPLIKRLRRAWGFMMTLSCSRHQFGKFVFDQKVETWLNLHREAFEFFGGVPGEIVLDNLKAAIVKAALYEPHVTKEHT